MSKNTLKTMINLSHGRKNMVLVLQIMNYREKTHLKNNFSINSSKHKKNSPFGFLTIKDKFIPLPSIARCGQSSEPFQNPQV